MAHGIVGRQDEIALVENFLEDQVSEPSALLIEGEPGIGKTTLFEELLRMARERGYCLLLSRPAHPEMDLSYLGLTEVLADVDEDVLRTLPSSQARILNVILRRDEPDGPVDRLTLCLAVLGAMRAAAGRGPLLIAMDDVQWLDRSTGRIFSYVVRRLGGTSTRVVLVRRTGEAEGWPFDLERAMPEGRLAAVRLEPLGPSDLSRMLRRRLGWAPAWPRVLRIAELSGGNPFYALEIARARGSVRSDQELDEPLPGSLLDLARSRLAKLPARVRETVELASVPRAPTIDLLQHLAPAALDLRGSLARAERAGIVTVDGGRIRFTHPILASAVYGSLPKARRLELHRAVALLSDDLEERARHLAIASEGPSADVAAALEGAAEQAWRRGAPDAAAHLLRTACRLTPPADQDALALRRIALGRILYHAGDAQDAAGELESLVAALPPGPIRARALYHLMYVARASEGMERSVAYGLQAAQEAADDPAFQSEVYGWLSRQADDDARLKLDTARKALEALERAPEPHPEVAFYARAAMVEAEFHGGLGIRLELLGDLPAETDARFPPVRTASRGDDLVGRLLGFAGRIDEAREILRGLRDRATVQNRSILPAVLGWMSVVEILAGRFRVAEALTEEAIERIEETGNTGVLLWVLGYHAIALTALGRLDEARSAAARALDMAEDEDPDRGLPQLGLGIAAMARGDFREAAEHLRVIDRAMRSVGLREPRWSMHAPELVEALIGAGELDEAAEALARFEEDAERSAGEWSLATSARCRALLCAAQGRLDDALEAADRSLRELRDLPFHFERARCLLVKGQVHRRRKEKRLADQALREALAAFEGMGTPLWADRARAELGRVGLRPHAPTELTETERRVAELAARGLTTKEIGEAAFVAPKTVTNVLGRIYRKLGIGSRAELGAVMSAFPSRDR